MRRALALAQRGFTNPNPMVGAIVVKDSQIIGEGFHPYAGAPHAEVFALENAGDSARGADLYVTLEPCCHLGRTPPCVNAIIAAGIRRVFAAMPDPNPKVAGEGLAALEKAGIEVHVGLLEDQARRLNEAYIKFIATNLPFVTLKMAMTLDGKIATRSGDSKWISCEASRRYVHKLRSRSDAVGIGLGTLLADNPKLTIRGVKYRRQPYRLVVDGLAQTPPESHILNSAGGEALIAVTSSAPKERIEKLQQAGARILIVDGNESLVELKSLVSVLGKEGITNVLLEGGGELAASALAARIVDKVVMFIAPKIIGGRDAKTPVEGFGVAAVAEGWQLENLTIHRFGCDVVVEAYPQYK